MTILTVFADRKKNVQILKKYLDRLLEQKLVKEVHLWNYTRNEEDKAYLKSISNLKRTSSISAGEYVDIFPVTRDSFTIRACGKNDFHINIVVRLSPLVDAITTYEIIIGAYENTRSIIRRNGFEVCSLEGRAIFSEMNDYTVHLNRLGVSLNGNLIMSTDLAVKNITNIMCKSGYGSSCVLDYETTQNNGFYYMDTCEMTRKNYYEYYTYGYKNEVILKCEDIVFMDVSKFKEYIEYIKNTDNDLVFANTINEIYNFQEDLIPRDLDGLHHYFIDNYETFLRLDCPNKIDNRVSANFFGVRGENWYKIAGIRDENITFQKGLKNIIFSNFYVSQLSKQDTNPEIIQKYDDLADSLTFGVSAN